MTSLKDDMFQTIQSSVDELESIWDYIGYSDEERSHRCQTAVSRVQTTLLDLIGEENKTRIELESRLDTQKRQIAEGCQALGLQPYFPPRGLTTYRLLKVLEEKAAELEEVKRDRNARLSDLRGQVERLCSLLDRADTMEALLTGGGHRDANADQVPPSEAELTQLSNTVSQLADTYAGLLQQFSTLREDILRIAGDIDFSPHPPVSHSNGFENGSRQVDPFEGAKDLEEAVFGPAVEALLKGGDSVRGTEVANGGFDLVLTPERLMQLEKCRDALVQEKARLMGQCDELRVQLSGLWRRLGMEGDWTSEERLQGYRPVVVEALQAEVSRCQSLKWERITVYLQNLCEEANHLYTMCFLDKQVALETDPSPADVAALELEIDELQERYTQNKGLYEAVGNYQRLWEQYLEVENKMKDPAILSNRGGILLKTEKEKKKLLKDLPKVEQEVNDIVAKFEADSKSDFRLPQGRTFTEYVQILWRDFKKAKEGTKYRRPKSANNEAATSGNSLNMSSRLNSTSPTASPSRVARK